VHRDTWGGVARQSGVSIAFALTFFGSFLRQGKKEQDINRERFAE